MEQKNSNWLKVYVIDVLPGLAVALYVLGFIYTGFYYSAFGINIEQYISLSEMLLAIILPLIFIVFVYILLLIFAYYAFYQSSLPFIRKKLDENIQKYKIDEEDKTKIHNRFIKKNNRLIKGLLISTILPLLLFIGITELRGYLNGVPSMIAPFMLCFFIMLFFVPLITLSTPRPKRSVMIFETVFVFYIFALIVFGYTGYKEGIYIKNHDTALFEIKTNDGTIFDNDSYRYLDQVNDRVFLLEKKTHNNVILGKESILYMKMKLIKPVNDKNVEK